MRHDLPLNFFIDRYVDSYLEEMQQFVDSVLGGTASRVDGSDGRVPVVMARATLRSQKENRPVRLS